MNLIILVIPTFGIYLAYYPIRSPQTRFIPKFLMSWLARMILLSPATGIIRVVGMSGRCYA